MDLRQIENIIAIEREQSISRAAEKLFLTQSALNQQLLKLEKELGTPLFERRKHSMIPTFAGRIYLRTAHQIVDMKKETYRIISDISEESTGEISVAYTPDTGAAMFSKIYPIFHEKYPNILFRIREKRVKKMEQLVLQNEVHFAFISYVEGFKNPDLDVRAQNFCQNFSKFLSKTFPKYFRKRGEIIQLIFAPFLSVILKTLSEEYFFQHPLISDTLQEFLPSFFLQF